MSITTTPGEAEAVAARVHALADEAIKIADLIPDDTTDCHGLRLKGFLRSVAGTLKSGDPITLRDAFLSMGAVAQRFIQGTSGPSN